MGKKDIGCKLTSAKFVHTSEAGFNVPLLTNAQLAKSTKALNQAYNTSEFKKHLK
jgi:hypothetical protein